MKYTWIVCSLIAVLAHVAQAQVPVAPTQPNDAAPLFPDRMGPAGSPDTPGDSGVAAPGTVGSTDTSEKSSADALLDAPPEAAPGAATLQRLANHRWTLAAASDAQAQALAALFPAAGRPYQFTFSTTGISVQGPCNSFAGGLQVTAEGLLEIPPLRATMMACAPELMAADSALSALLVQPLRIEFLEGAITQLQLQTAANDTLLLEGQLTPEALYGPGEIQFLEVDSRRLACRNPRSAQTTCLQVRELAFDEQGLRIPPPGPWKPFYDTIDGYTHVPGERNVLRVKRFERGNAKGSAAPYLYVLDMVVETETVPE